MTLSWFTARTSTTKKLLASVALGASLPAFAETTHTFQYPIQSTKPIEIKINPDELDLEFVGKVPVHFSTESSNVQLNGRSGVTVNKSTEKSPVIELTMDSVTDEMVGKSLKLVIEKEVEYSRLAQIGAFVPQVLPVALMENRVAWTPPEFFSSMARWNYLMLDIHIMEIARKALTNGLLIDEESVFNQCVMNFAEGFALYSAGATYGEGAVKLQDGHEVSTKMGAFRTFLNVRTANNFTSCISNAVAASLIDLKDQGKLDTIFGDWSKIDLMNDDSLTGIAQLMTGYGFNFIVGSPGIAVAKLRDSVGFAENKDIAKDLTSAVITSLQYHIHNGYINFFKGQGFDDVASHGLASTEGLLEIGYHFYMAGEAPTNVDASDGVAYTHHMNSLKDRVEAMVSSPYGLIPEIKGPWRYAVPAAAIGGTYLGFKLYEYLGNTNNIAQTAVQASMLGLWLFVLAPYGQELATWVTQKVADTVMDVTDSDEEGWIGYFAAKDVEYKISVEVVD